MDKPVRLDEPVITPKRTPSHRKNKVKRNYVIKPATLMSEEERKKRAVRSYNWIQNNYERFVSNVVLSEKKRRAKSIRFYKNYSRKMIATPSYAKRAKEVKTCTKCGRTMSVLAFDGIKDPKKSDKVKRPYCFQCRRKMNREYYRKNKEKWAHINDKKNKERENDTKRVCSTEQSQTT